MSTPWDDPKQVSVIGLARSGLAAANALARRGWDVLVSDSKAAEDRKRFLDDLDDRVTTRFGENVVRPGDLVVISPGIPPHAATYHMAVREGREVISEVELFQRLRPEVPLVAITGTDGKSTTTTIAAQLVEAAGLLGYVGGNLGNPLCLATDTVTPDQVVVAEVSCFQLQSSPGFRPKAAVVTNIAEDHVSYHGSMEAYIAAKRRVFAHMEGDDVVILNADDPVVSSFARDVACRVETFSARGDQATASLVGGEVLLDGKHLVAWDDVPLQGAHNVENALGAILLARAAGATEETIRAAIQHVVGLPHRLEHVRTLDGVDFVNDSKATNPHAAVAVLTSFDKPLVVIMGGSEKGVDMEEVFRLLPSVAKHVVFVGETAERWHGELAGRAPSEVVDTFEGAVARARALAAPGDAVVLCPGSASFDLFDDYEHRGAVFKDLVHKL